jgi:DNA-directed RNA polymerase alpha subunit
MNATSEVVWQALAKIQIALGYGVREGDIVRHPNFDRARMVLEQLRADLKAPIDQRPIEEIGLDAQICVRLRRAGVVTVGELRVMSDEELLALPQIRAGRVQAIDEALGRVGVRRAGAVAEGV